MTTRKIEVDEDTLGELLDDAIHYEEDYQGKENYCCLCGTRTGTSGPINHKDDCEVPRLEEIIG